VIRPLRAGSEAVAAEPAGCSSPSPDPSVPADGIAARRQVA
jgi:hypothetical protein